MHPKPRRSRLPVPALIALALTLGGIVAHRLAQPPPPQPRPIGSTAPAAASALPPVATESPAAASAVAAAQPADGQLISFFQPANAAALTAALPAPARDVRYVRINPELIEGKQSPFWQPRDTGRLVLPLPDGGEATVVILESESLGLRRFTSVGRIEGRPESRAIFAYNEGFLHAHLEDPDLGEYELRAATDSLHQYYKVDPEQVVSCSGAVAPVLDAEALAEVARRKAAQEDLSPRVGQEPGERQPQAATVGARAQVDLMMLYTQAVLPTMSGASRTAALQTAFDAAVALLNSDLQASLVEARVRLVRIAEVTYAGDELSTSTTNWQSPMLTRLRGTTDGFMDEIHALRDQSGADIVCLAQQRFDTQSAGIAYSMQVNESSLDRYLNPLFAFAVVQYSFMTVQHIFPHEMGHVFGCAHNRENSIDATTGALRQGAYPYSYGHRYTAANGRNYRDIMSYDSSPASYTRLGYFSTPLVKPPESPADAIGVAVGQVGEADAALTIDQNAFEASAFRLQTQAPATNGTLYAVSTLAQVGTAVEQQLIGAFIISGSSPKRMLLRGNGPSLASTGVSTFLSDPKLTLYRLDGGTRIVAENDNWETNANAAAIAAAGGTTPLAGSRDSALLLDLDPGVYTANVTSGDGSAGFALVEVYEIGASTTEITALSTRGYSSNDRVMIAGFVVSGAAGTTKRIVIRGQGPSMGRYQGIAGAMDDPYLELYNGNGDRIFANDDWAIQNQGTSSDDFLPVATGYAGQRIAAAGMAPGNRREPCIMVDLPPGNYTAILKPFQNLTATPAQVGTPGVALVEVYEVP